MNIRLSSVFDRFKVLIILISILLIIISGISVVFNYSLGLDFYDFYDYYEGVFWAKASLEAGCIVNTDYSYYYFLPFGSNLLMLPFVSSLGVSYLSNQLGMLLFFVIYLLTLYKLARSLFDTVNNQLIFCLVSLLFVFTFAGDNLLHHLLGYGIGLVSLMGQLSCAIDIRKNKKIIYNYVLLTFYLLWGSLNGSFTLVLSNIPVLISLCTVDYYQKRKFDKNQIRLIVYSFFVTAIGFVVFKYLNSLAISTVGFDSRYEFVSLHEIFNNIIYLLEDYFKVIINSDIEYIPFFSTRGIFTFIKIFFGIAILWFSGKKTSDYIKSETITADYDNTLFVFSNLLVIVICVFAYIFSEGSSHYFFNVITSMLMMCGYYLINNTSKYIDLLIIAIIAISLLFSFKCIFITYPNSLKTKNIMVGDVVREIEEEGLTYGYTYCMVIDKQLDLYTNERIYTSMALFDETKQKFFINKTRVFNYDLMKPEKIDKFFIICRKVESSNIIDNCYKTIDIENMIYPDLCIYVFDIEKWDAVIVSE